MNNGWRYRGDLSPAQGHDADRIERLPAGSTITSQTFFDPGRAVRPECATWCGVPGALLAGAARYADADIGQMGSPDHR